MLKPLQTVDHYENFPVASFLLPKAYRKPITNIYYFARYADDLADEGSFSTQERLTRLEECNTNLYAIVAGKLPTLPIFQALMTTYKQHNFPIKLCLDLIYAFQQDVVKTRYQDREELIEYCRYSANPIGRLLLHIFNCATPSNLVLSDKICTALQLVNFLQDITIDYNKGRLYLPQTELKRFKVNEADIVQKRFTPAFSNFMKYQIIQAKTLLQSGALLGNLLPGRIGLEIRMVIIGGHIILRKLYRLHGNVFAHRPLLTKRDWLYILCRSLICRHRL